jgi:hypothetical protein
VSMMGHLGVMLFYSWAVLKICRYEIGGDDDPDVIAEVRLFAAAVPVCLVRDCACRGQPLPRRGIAPQLRMTESVVNLWISSV